MNTLDLGLPNIVKVYIKRSENGGTYSMLDSFSILKCMPKRTPPKSDIIEIEISEKSLKFRITDYIKDSNIYDLNINNIKNWLAEELYTEYKRDKLKDDLLKELIGE